MLEGRCALVTGSSARTGIGYAVAEALAREGCNVMLSGRGGAPEAGELAAGLAAAYAVEAGYAAAELARPADIEGLIDQTVGRLGRLDILVNNAGTNYPNPVDVLSPGEWDETIAVNLSAAYHTIRLALPAMRQRGWGRIVNIASVLGLVGAANVAAYTASKHGLVGLTKSVSLETADSGITCNAICPGYSRTGLLLRNIEELAAIEGATPESTTAAMLERDQPSRTMVAPADIASLAVFLCSDAAREIRGAALPIDGGWCAR